VVTSGPPEAGLFCSRCGERQPGEGPLAADDGTPISLAEYVALSTVLGGALVCSGCASASGRPRHADQRRSTASAGIDKKDLRMSGPSHLEIELDERECWRLLKTTPFGRLGFTERALPVVLPSHFIVRDRELVLASLQDGKVSSACRGAIVAFEVDAYDGATQEGWCVSMLGRSRLITDPREVNALDVLGFSPWTDHPDRHYIAIGVSGLRGKRLIQASGAGV
jgi:hypothetical protein